jgi:hypothetical protein
MWTHFKSNNYHQLLLPHLAPMSSHFQFFQKSLQSFPYYFLVWLSFAKLHFTHWLSPFKLPLLVFVSHLMWAFKDQAQLLNCYFCHGNCSHLDTISQATWKSFISHHLVCLGFLHAFVNFLSLIPKLDLLTHLASFYFSTLFTDLQLCPELSDLENSFLL